MGCGPSAQQQFPATLPAALSATVLLPTAGDQLAIAVETSKRLGMGHGILEGSELMGVDDGVIDDALIDKVRFCFRDAQAPPALGRPRPCPADKLHCSAPPHGPEQICELNTAHVPTHAYAAPPPPAVCRC